MRRLWLASTASAVALVLAAAGCGGGGGVSLRSAEAAFAHQHIRFQSDWSLTQKNSNLSQSHFGGVTSLLPRQAVPHVRGAAWSVSSATFHSRLLFVLDSASEAKQLAADRHLAPTTGNQNVVLVARNVVYEGDDSPAARRAMATLRG